jgi:hypothetical protein
MGDGRRYPTAYHPNGSSCAAAAPWSPSGRATSSPPGRGLATYERILRESIPPEIVRASNPFCRSTRVA